MEEAAAQHEKDSGVGRTDESTKNEESSEENLEQLEAALDAASSATLPPHAHPVPVAPLTDACHALERLPSKCASTSTSNLDVSTIQPESNAVGKTKFLYYELVKENIL